MIGWAELDLEPAGIITHQDQDAVFTSYGWRGQLLLADKLRLLYALNGAKDNTVMESFFCRFNGRDMRLTDMHDKVIEEVLA